MKLQCGGRRRLGVAWCFLVVLQSGLLATGEEVGEVEVEKPLVTSIVRHHQGDIYTLPETEETCRCREGGGVMTVGPSEGCQCQCPSATATFRDDTGTCVSTLTECPLADFVSSSGPEKVPYVFMPLKHQLVHPTAEVALLGLEHGGTPLLSPVCVVTKGSILTQAGWRNMANTSTFEPPFRLFRDGGRTYVQWVGEEAERAAAEGRLVLVTLICRDAAQPSTPVFRPCLAFRVAGSPGAAEAALSAPARGQGAGLSSAEGAIIGLVVTCLSVTYVVAMAVYIRVKKRKEREQNISKLAEEGLRGSKSRSGRDHRRPRHARPSLVSSEDDSEHEDIEDLSLASRSRRASRAGNSISFTTAVVHGEGERVGAPHPAHDAADGIERAPRSPLAVVETFDEGSVGGSGARAMGVVSPVEEREGGPDDIHAAQAKRKLYFNPAYFEPEMLQAPPPAAIEFLTRIREMITIAKSKMKAKTYHPSLVDIPEEDYDCQSRPLSRSTASSSRMTVAMDDLQDGGDGEGVYASDHSIQSDSLERRPREDDSRSSTLKKLAKRVNSHGQSIVSEIIRTLDLKPRLPAPVESVYVAHTPPRRPTAPKPPPPKPVNAREDTLPENDDDFPELIKPSMLRSVLRDGKRLTDLNNTFENFRQEMMATFNKMKKVSEAISPKSTLQRVKNRNKAEASPVGTLEKGKSHVTSSEGKVQKWLQTLENKNMYSRMSETSNVVFDSRKAMPRSNSPPPLPQKGNKPPTPPRKNRVPAQRSISFNDTKEAPLQSPEEASHSKDNSKTRAPGNSTQVTRSLSWQNEHRHYDSNPRRSRQQMPLMPEDSLNTSFGSEDDSLNDLLSEAEAKVPKMIPSDSDSVYSDTKPRSKEKKASHKEEIDTNSKSLSRQLPREEEITERNEIFNKNTGAKTMSRLAKNGDSIYEERNNNSITSEDYDDHTYEEIQFPNNGKQKRRAPPKPKNNNVSEVHIDNDDDDGHYSIYSNPESLVSEVTILGEEKCSSPIYSGCKVTIPVIDNGNGSTEDKDNGFDQDTLERRGKKAERSNSIVQDSLERPKVKKRTFANHENSLERAKAQRRLSFPGDKNRGDKSLLDIYESRSSIRSLRSFKSDKHDPSYSPITFSNPSSPTKTESFYFKNISNNTNLGVIKNSEPPKKLRTFKDYQEMNFHRGSSDSSETSSSPLPVTGSSINVNFRSTSPSNKEHRELKPPLPPKQARPTDPSENASPGLPPKNRIARPPLPLKASRRSDSSDSEPERPKLPEKSRKKASLDTLSRSSSGSSIPELTEEEARSILHGLLAHTQPDANRLSPLHEEDDNDGHFLGVRNTVADSNTRPSVPYYDTFSSGSQNSLTPTSSSSPRSDDIEGTGSNTLGREVEHSLDRQLLRRQDSSCEPGSPGSEARVSGEFILSTTGKSPSLRRQSSLSREQTSGFLAKLRDITDDDVDGETLTKGMEIALALKAKSDLEKHFKEKSGADSIKRTWRKIIEKVDDSKEDKDKISIMKFQQYMASLERKEKEAKLKQEDSGYHSTDSSESANSKNSLVSTASLGESPLAAPPELPFQIGTGNRPVRSLSYTSSLQRPLFQRSMSLQQLGRSASQLELSPQYETGSFKRASMRASLGRRHHGADMDGLSIYVNNSFAADDDDNGNVAL